MYDKSLRNNNVKMEQSFIFINLFNGKYSAFYSITKFKCYGEIFWIKWYAYCDDMLKVCRENLCYKCLRLKMYS